MRTIPLTQGRVAMVDDADYEALSRFKWCYGAGGYARRHLRDSELGVGRWMQMHRFLLDARLGQEVDHINGNTLDNRRANLRLCSHQQNQHNRGPHRDSLTGVKGVTFDKRCGRYQARIMVDYKNKYLGYFPTLEEAAAAYARAVIGLHGEFARTTVVA